MAIDAKQFQSLGIYQAKAPLRSILDDLGQVGKILLANKARRKMLRLAAGAALLVGLGSAVAAAATGSGWLKLCAVAGFVPALALFIYSFIYGRALIKHQDRLQLMQDLAQSLTRDVHKSAPLSAKLVLKAAPTLIKEEPWTARKSGKQQFFEEEFLSLEVELLDGTVLSETVEELTRKRTYRNPRGKYKTKSRSRYFVTLRFGYPSDLYGDARTANDTLHEEVRVPSSATVRDVRVTEKAVVVKAMVALRQDVVQSSEMLSMGAYRILNLARRLAGSAPGAAS
ncbi:MAG: hypothetical protein ABSE86_30715 [Bryobacteraceae bacterium]|jgi:hypothetical protein